MLLDVLADFIAILVGHDHIGDYHVGIALLDVRQRARSICISNNFNVFAPERDLDDFAHGCTVIDKNYCRSASHLNLPVE